MLGPTSSEFLLFVKRELFVAIYCVAGSGQNCSNFFIVMKKLEQFSTEPSILCRSAKVGYVSKMIYMQTNGCL